MTAENLIRIPVAPGELIDKITILEIKAERISDFDKLENIRRELEILKYEQDQNLPLTTVITDLTSKLKDVNERIWDLEDTIRDCERSKDFGEVFLDTARMIYRTNDERAALKKEINLHLGSQIVEEKSYSAY